MKTTLICKHCGKSLTYELAFSFAAHLCNDHPEIIASNFVNPKGLNKKAKLALQRMCGP